MTSLLILVVGDPFDDPDTFLDALNDGEFDSRADWAADPEALGDKHYDVVIVDYQRAARMLEIAAADARDTPVIVVSDRPGEVLAIEMLQRGAADYVLTSGLQRLGPAIERALEVAQSASLRRSHDRLARLLLENSLDLIVSVDVGGNLVVVNSAAKSMLGYEPEELVGQNISAFLHPEDVERTLASFGTVLSGELVGDLECRCVHKSGEIRHTLWSLAAAESDVITSVGRDITARRHAEVRLRQERDYADAIINSLPGIFFHYDQDMNILRWNETVAPTTGYTDDDIATMHPYEFIAPPDRELAADAIAELYVAGTTHREMRYLFKDGTQAPHVFTASRFDYDGRPGFVGMGIDITERKRIEEELRRETALFEAMVENAPDGIVVMDREHRRIIHNQRLNELWGVPEEIAADPDTGRLIEFIRRRTKNPDEFLANVRWLIDHPEQTGSDEVELDDGTVLYRITGPVVGHDGHYYGRIWTFRDITAYRDAERQLRHLATHDGLTGLPNRSLIEQHIEQLISRARDAGENFAVLYLDLDGFKVINDGYGHAFGDTVLKAVGGRLVSLLEPHDVVARHGGDEFLILLPDCEDAADAGALAQRIVDDLAEPVIVAGHLVSVSSSVGVSVFPRDGTTCEALIAKADAAMYRAKGRGRG